MKTKSIAAILLAAGLSKRLGRPKGLLRLNGETLIERAVRIAAEAGLAPVLAVLADASLITPLHERGVHVIVNRYAYEGMATSIVLGVQWAQAEDVDGVVVLTCDQPALTAAHLRELVAVPGHSAGSGYAGRVGVPAYFPAVMFPQMLGLKGDMGARTLLHNARVVHAEELALDIDTEDDLARARELFGDIT